MTQYAFTGLTEEQVRLSIEEFCPDAFGLYEGYSYDGFVIPVYNVLNNWFMNPGKDGYTCLLCKRLRRNHNIMGIFSLNNGPRSGRYSGYMFKHFDKKTIRAICKHLSKGPYVVDIINYFHWVIPYEKFYDLLDIKELYNLGLDILYIKYLPYTDAQKANIIVKMISSHNSRYHIIYRYRDYFDFGPKNKIFPHNLKEIKMWVNHFKYQPGSSEYENAKNRFESIRDV